jgi:hypothetical protein
VQNYQPIHTTHLMHSIPASYRDRHTMCADAGFIVILPYYYYVAQP